MSRSERKKFRTKALRRIKNFENAVRAYEMKGSQPPEELDRIEEWHKVARARLIKFIMGLYEKTVSPDMMGLD